MRALQLTAAWPVPNVAAAVVLPDGSVTHVGSTAAPFQIASVAKVLTTWAVLVAVEEGTVHLDAPVGQPGCSLRHLLAHAGGYGFDGREPIARPGTRRIYSNTGIELAASSVEDASGLPFAQYLHEAVLGPLGMAATGLHGSPAHAAHSTVDDLVRFLHELRHPRLIALGTAADALSVQYPPLNGIVPGVGRFAPCPWGLGIEIRGHKHPHWTGADNSASTFGHFGGAGTFLWVDPVARTAVVALTDRPFDTWSADALRVWPAFSDAVLAEVGE